MAEEVPEIDHRTVDPLVVKEFRATKGNISLEFFNRVFPMLHREVAPRFMLLHHTGRKSGLARVTPLGRSKRGDEYLLFAANNGAPKHTDWYYNLVAQPRCGIEDGDTLYATVAHLTHGAEREMLYEWIIAVPGTGDHRKLLAETTEREIPIFRLEVVGQSPAPQP